MRKLIVLVVLSVVGYHVMAADTLKIANTEPATKATKVKVTNLSDVFNSEFYPVELRKQGIEGKVMVDVWIDNKGEMVKYEILEASHETLEKLVMSHLSLLEFEPAKNAQGVSINSVSKLPFNFSLNVD